MKKIICILFAISILYIFSQISFNDSSIIPSSSIRFRIIANSNSLQDQLEKSQIKKDLIKNVIPNLLQNDNISSSRINIQNYLPVLDNYLSKYEIPYTIKFGNNYFPEKKYKGVTYQAGNYESLVITLGQGLGDNWWCVLYPPLCLIEEDENISEVEFKSYLQDKILK